MQFSGAGYISKKFSPIKGISTATRDNAIFSANKRLISKQVVAVSVTDVSCFWGFSETADFGDNIGTTTSNRAGFFFRDNTNTVYAITAGGSGESQTATSINTSAEALQFHEYRIDFDSDTGEVKYYIDGNLEATHSSNLPASSNDIAYGFYVGGTNQNFYMSPSIISQKIY